MVFFGMNNCVMIYNVDNDEWETKKVHADYELYFKTYCAAVTVHGNRVLLIGGGLSDDILEFDPKSFKVALRTKMQHIRTEHACVCIDDKVYIMGGYDKKINKFLQQCEIYDPAENRLLPMESMNIAKCGFALAHSDRKIYTIGGFSGSERVPDVEVYDIATDSWKLLAVKLPNGITNSAAVAISPCRILIFGGG